MECNVIRDAPKVILNNNLERNLGDIGSFGAFGTVRNLFRDIWPTICPLNLTHMDQNCIYYVKVEMVS